MEKLLTPSLFKLLIESGYFYCLSKTICADNEDADVFITLTPVKDEPNLRELPEKHDTYFYMMDEPKQMAGGVDDLIILVNLTGLRLSAAIH